MDIREKAWNDVRGALLEAYCLREEVEGDLPQSDRPAKLARVVEIAGLLLEQRERLRVRPRLDPEAQLRALRKRATEDDRQRDADAQMAAERERKG